MNKLRKPRPEGIVASENQTFATGAKKQPSWTVTSTTSRTFQYATTLDSTRKSSAAQSVAFVRPQTEAEQYWAARALVAETLLYTKAAHNEEVRQIITSEEVKRSREISDLRKMYKKGQTKLEIFILVLLGILFTGFSLLLFLLVKSDTQQQPSRAPAHFTIPILSPFTSVVEHEMSTMSFRTTSCLLLFGCILLYAIYRHWIGRLHAR
ncbi:hypothetical protein GLOTRDRAFT_117780 [Gloeophyllum trabeum ATCC 11539]|uniref:Uncharacterized protein n=1 Tax=Gloeophyllum trabeum (strain ATCC 11539 / FP-39264 / Madison 617) TaxID=670483 RepID=S7PVW6_GLOTA|nr:uncharacterized protein GLOTRDRAFT_117780 [Gloeophyllum trabeum ATCC 11539]EPQ51776.1 hypothetical protein GLOTRDRAFT_117780 [Gloeophyllum trabeum ATCC 11539]